MIEGIQIVGKELFQRNWGDRYYDVAKWTSINAKSFYQKNFIPLIIRLRSSDIEYLLEKDETLFREYIAHEKSRHPEREVSIGKLPLAGKETLKRINEDFNKKLDD